MKQKGSLLEALKVLSEHDLTMEETVIIINISMNVLIRKRSNLKKEIEAKTKLN